MYVCIYKMIMQTNDANAQPQPGGAIIIKTPVSRVHPNSQCYYSVVKSDEPVTN